MNENENRSDALRRDIAEREARLDAGDLDEMWVTPEQPRNIIRKTYEPQPRPRPSTATMDPETQKRWDEWLDHRIALALDEYRQKMLTPTIAEFVSEYVHTRLATETAKLREEIGAVRADQTIDRSIERGEVSKLRGSVPMRRGRNVA